MATSKTSLTGCPQNDHSIDDGFVRLIMQHQRQLFVYLRTILNSPADAEEVLQETYVVLWRKRRQFVMGTNFLNWAMTVAQYEVRRFRRTHKNIPQMVAEALLLQVASEMVAEDGLIEARHKALKQCLETLNDHDRHLVSATYSIKPTEKDIDQRLRMTPGGFRKAMHRVRQRLLKCIQLRLRAEGFV